MLVTVILLNKIIHCLLIILRSLLFITSGGQHRCHKFPFLEVCVTNSDFSKNHNCLLDLCNVTQTTKKENPASITNFRRNYDM